MQKEQLKRPYLAPEIVSVAFKVEIGQGDSNGKGQLQVPDPTENQGYSLLGGMQRGQQGDRTGSQFGMGGYFGGDMGYGYVESAGGYFGGGSEGGYF